MISKVLSTAAITISIIISVIALYFSVTGWMALFAATPFGVMMMFGIIETGKVAAVAILHWFWDTMKKVHKIFMIVMVIATMLITSMGIFGYLSKGYLDQELPQQYISLSIERSEEQLSRYNMVIESSTERLQRLDSIIDTLVAYDKISGPDGARAVQKNQEEERKLLNNRIDNATTNIEKVQKALLETKQKSAETQSKLGPLKYIVDLLGMNDQTDTAIQIVIAMAIFVFDPFAIILLISGLWIINQNKPKVEPKVEPKVDVSFSYTPVNKKMKRPTLTGWLD